MPKCALTCMHLACALEWTEDTICDRHLRHAPGPSNDLRGMNVTHVLEQVGDMGSNDSMAGDNLMIFFAELDWLDVVAFRYCRAQELSSSEPNLNPLRPRAPWRYDNAILCCF